MPLSGIIKRTQYRIKIPPKAPRGATESRHRPTLSPLPRATAKLWPSATSSPTSAPSPVTTTRLATSCGNGSRPRTERQTWHGTTAPWPSLCANWPAPPHTKNICNFWTRFSLWTEHLPDRATAFRTTDLM